MRSRRDLKFEPGVFTLVAFVAVVAVPPGMTGAAKPPRSKDPEAAIRLTELPIKQVVIDDRFWSPRLEVNRTKTLDHAYQQLEATGSIRNFDVAAKKVTGGFS